MASEYKVGTISELLASQAQTPGDGKKKKKSHAKLEALFGASVSNGSVAPQVFRTIKVAENKVFKTKSPGEKVAGIKEKKKKKGLSEDGIILKHRDAVEARRKIEKANRDLGVGGDQVKKEKKKKDKSKQKKVKGDGQADEIQDETVSTTSPPEEVEPLTKKQLKKLRQKEKKRLLEKEGGGEEKKKLASVTTTKKKKRLQRRKERESGDAKAEQSNGIEDMDVSTAEVKVKKEKQKVKKEEQTNDAENIEEAPAQKTVAERNTPKPKDPELEARTVFVGNLPQDTVKKDVQKIFKKLGKLETVRLRCVAPNKPKVLKKVAIYKKEHHPDKNTLAAYVRYSSREEAEKAVAQARGIVLKDHHLTVDLAVPDRKRDPKRAIFVGNLDMKLSDEELWRFFEDCGPIEGVRIIRDNETGLGKGFGYVNFQNKETVEKALKKNDEQLRNRAVRISKCVKKLKVKKNLGSDLRNGGKGPKDKFSKKPDVKRTPKPVEKQSRKDKVPVVGKERRHKRVADWKMKQAEFSGDKLAEVGKLKRKSNKPNRGELRKAKFAKMLNQPNKRGIMSRKKN